MTPRQKKRLNRASGRVPTVAFIRLRDINRRFTAAIDAAFQDVLHGHKKAADALRDEFKKQLCDMVLRPIVRAVVRDMAGVMQ